MTGDLNPEQGIANKKEDVIPPGELGSRQNPYHGVGAMDVRTVLSNSRILAGKWSGHPRAFFEFHGDIFSINWGYEVGLAEGRRHEGLSEEEIKADNEKALSFVREKADEIKDKEATLSSVDFGKYLRDPDGRLIRAENYRRNNTRVARIRQSLRNLISRQKT